MSDVDDFLELERQHERDTLFGSYENLLTFSEGFGLTSASIAQRAICRAYEGRDLADAWDDPGVREIFHFKPKVGLRPAEFLFLAGIRVGKTLFAAAAAVYQAHTCSLEYAPGYFLKEGEMPRVSIVSLKKDNALECYNKIKGTMEARPALKKLLVGYDAETIYVLHKSGHVVEIKVVAGARTGGTLISRWSAGVIFDEAPRMLGDEEAVVNLDEQRKATLGRMLPNTTIWYVGSPKQPWGPVFEMHNNNWQKPDAEVMVVKGKAFIINPITWTKEKCDELKKKDVDAYNTDVLAEFSDPEQQLFKYEVVKAITRDAPQVLAPRRGMDYRASMDPATRSNSWTIVIVTMEGGVIRVVGCWQWTGTKERPLDPSVVLDEIKTIISLFGIPYVKTDQYAVDFIISMARSKGFGIIQDDRDEASVKRAFLNLARRMEAGMVELPPNEEHGRILRQDLLMVKRKPSGGVDKVKIVVPQTGDGRHCDMAVAFQLAADEWLDEPVAEVPQQDEEPVPEDEKLEIEQWEREQRGLDEEDDDFDDSWVDYHD